MTKVDSEFIRCPCCGSKVDKDSPNLRHFIGDICELRTPINSIIGFSRSLLSEDNGPLNNKQQEDLNLIHNSGTHLLGLINDIIDTAKLWSGNIELQQQNLDLRKAVNEVVESTKPLIRDKPVQIN